MYKKSVTGDENLIVIKWYYYYKWQPFRMHRCEITAIGDNAF